MSTIQEFIAEGAARRQSRRSGSVLNQGPIQSGTTRVQDRRTGRSEDLTFIPSGARDNPLYNNEPIWSPGDPFNVDEGENTAVTEIESYLNAIDIEAPQINPQHSLTNTRAEAVANLMRQRIGERVVTDLSTSALGDLGDQQQASLDEAIDFVIDDFGTDVVDPIRESQQELAALADQMMSGILPDDVEDQILQQSAETLASQGIFGEAALYATAADLGQASQQMVVEGTELTSDVALAGLSAVQAASAAQAPLADANEIYSAVLGAMGDATLLSTRNVLEQNLIMDVTNADLQWAAEISSWNLAADMYETAMTWRVGQEMFQ